MLGFAALLVFKPFAFFFLAGLGDLFLIADNLVGLVLVADAIGWLFDHPLLPVGERPEG